MSFAVRPRIGCRRNWLLIAAMLWGVSDDDLIARLRRRAYNPATRLDEAYVPRDWLQRNYGDEAVSRVLSWSAWSTDREAAVFGAGAPEAVEFFKGAPHEPPRPPVTLSELMAAEQRMGCRLPELLERLYTEVGNGGFGPQHGILAIAPSGPDDECGPTAVGEYLKHPELNEPLGLPLVGAGCTLWWYVSLTKPGNPVYLFEWDLWLGPERGSPEAAIHHTVPTLAEWLGRWADGHDVWPHSS